MIGTGSLRGLKLIDLTSERRSERLNTETNSTESIEERFERLWLTESEMKQPHRGSRLLDNDGLGGHTAVLDPLSEAREQGQSIGLTSAVPCSTTVKMAGLKSPDECPAVGSQKEDMNDNGFTEANIYM